jgi:hypothetical protein
MEFSYLYMMRVNFSHAAMFPEYVVTFDLSPLAAKTGIRTGGRNLL